MVLYGKPVAEKIYQGFKNIRSSMAVVLVGEDPASLSYTKIKEKIADRLGIEYKLFHLPGIVTQKEVEKLINDLNQNKYVDGIVIQLPLPNDIDTERIISLISPAKDVDGFLGKFPAPTPQAILEILKFYHIEIKNKKIVIVGHGRLVGKPLEKIFLKQNIQAIICDLKTKNLKEKTIKADILISAVGVPGLIKSEMVKKEAIIIDAGTAEAGGKIVGDVSRSVYEKVSTYTPNPGGVGPVTVAVLMKNLVEATKVSEKR